MSYVSILKNIPEIISQPASIAAIASVGLHGAIAFILPLMPVDSSKPKASAASKTVGLVELNKTEQNRLPQAPTSLALQPLPGQVPGLPNFASQPSVLPPLPPGASTQAGLAPLPSSFNNLPIDSLPKKQSYQALPKSTQLRIDNSFNAKTAYQAFPRFNRDIKAATSQGLPRSTAPVTVGQTQPLPRYTTPATVGGSQPLPRYTAPATVGQSQPVPPDNLPELQANNVPPDLSSSAPIVSETTPGSTVQESTTAQTPVSADNGSNVVPTQEFVTPVGQTPQANDKLALAGQTLPQWQQQQQATAAPTLPSSATQQVLAKTTSFGDQFLEVKQQYPNFETRQLISKTINAQAGQEGKVEGGLVVDTEGKVADIKFLDSSVSSELKTAARDYFREYFQSNPAQPNGKPKYYPFSLAFKSNGSNPEPTTAIPNSPPIQSNQTESSSDAKRNIIQPQPLRSPRAIPQSSQQGQENKVSQQSPANLPPLRVRKNSQLPTLEAAKSGLPELQITSNSPLPTPESTPKPTLSQSTLRNNSSATGEATAKPVLPNLRVRTNQPVIPVVEGTAKGASPQLQVRTNQPIIPIAEGTAKGASPQLQVRNNQPEATSQATAKPASQSQVSSNQSTSATESSKKLTLREQLRQFRDKKQTSNQEK